MKYDVVDVVESKYNNNKEDNTWDDNEIYSNIKESNTKNAEDDGFIEVKSKKSKNKQNENNKILENWGDDDWITSENINEKLHKMGKVSKTVKAEEKSPIRVTIFSSDFTLQNLSLKIGIPIMSLDNMLINKIKHYILKCYSCSNFIFDTSKLFCEFCGYNTLMKIGCSINKHGRMRVYDKKAEARLRGTQVKKLFF
jgi:RNA-binding protein NOB1